ncbi:MAG TPA: carbamate kinase [Acidimicrobiales bacterium]|nr:carbamate kinase [Acidimicrobiales bacterium]
MLVVAALGGNALLRRGEKPDADIQEEHVASAAAALAPLARAHRLVLTHGNGPQVGQLALESARDPDLSAPYPFDALVAQTQGVIGYWLQKALANALATAQDRPPVVSLVTQTLVDPADPAFGRPTKFVGPGYDEEGALRLAKQWGWAVRQDGTAWRRVVPSPEPEGFVEIDQVRQLVGSGAVVVAAGGGGVPVRRAADGRLCGVEAVVDKDLTAELLAEQLGADALLLLTDVPAVELDHGTAAARPLGRVSPAFLRGQSFPAGSMGPKVDACCRFVERTGKPAAIGLMDDAAAILAGDRGTVVSADDPRAAAQGTPAPT